MHWILYSLFLTCIASLSALSPQPGVLHYEFSKDDSIIGVPRALYKGSEISVQVSCHADKGANNKVLTVLLNLTELFCWPESVDLETNMEIRTSSDNLTSRKSVEKSCLCPCHIDLNPEPKPATSVTNVDSIPGKAIQSITVQTNNNDNNNNIIIKEANQTSDHDLQKNPGSKGGPFAILNDGAYFLTVKVTVTDKDKDTDHKNTDGVKDDAEVSVIRNITVDIKMKGPYGYLSAVDWPLLTFYGAMCFVYIIFGIAWLVVSFMQWRDLLRIQFWIGAVILLGMLEKAMFFAEYDTINNVGKNLVPGIVLLAEWISCAKRTLARMLVIIVSLGFGIVKPRLGSHLSRILCIGFVYFFAAAWEAYSRVTDSQNSQLPSLLMATVVLAILDSFICWWIFSNLVHTTRTLRLRRNLIKLTLYSHFTNTLICAVILSVIFMLYSIKSRRIFDCIEDWKEIWIDDAFWHLLFSIILLVIMILWRPTNNNQRYAFSPLLDVPDDDDDDEDIEQFVNDAYGVKMRGYSNCHNDSPKHHKSSSNSADDDLRWVEENIPSNLMSTALPIIDSDEEIMNTKFEISKME